MQYPMRSFGERKNTGTVHVKAIIVFGCGFFSQKNIQKTAEAYEKMSSVQPGLTYSDAADAWSDSALADVIVPGLLLFLGWAIFRKEKEAGCINCLEAQKRSSGDGIG